MIRKSWARAASIEETLALWAASLREVKHRIRPLFTQERVATNAGLFLEGLLGDEQRKTGWMRAEAAGDPGPWRQQAILVAGIGTPMRCAISCVTMSSSIWRMTTRCWWSTRPAFSSKAKASCEWRGNTTGSAGKITNCQIGVFATYVSRHGHAFIDRALYLPKDWNRRSGSV